MSRFLSASVLVVLLATPVFAANKFTVGRVESIGLDDLPKHEAAQIRALLVGKTFDAEQMDYLLKTVRWALQDMGYFKSQVDKANLLPLRAGENSPVLLSFSLSAGERFHAGEISVTGSKVATPEELRRLIPLETGAVFNVSKIREGMEAIKQFYAKHGYLGTVFNVEQRISDDPKTVSVNLEIVEN